MGAVISEKMEAVEISFFLCFKRDRIYRRHFLFVSKQRNVFCSRISLIFPSSLILFRFPQKSTFSDGDVSCFSLQEERFSPPSISVVAIFYSFYFHHLLISKKIRH